MKRIFALPYLMSVLLVGCGNNTAPMTSQKPHYAGRIPSTEHRSQASNRKVSTVFHLSRLWRTSRSQVKAALRSYKLMETDTTPSDYPDPSIAGGEVKDYDLGGDKKLDVWFNTKGYAEIVLVEDEANGLGFALDQWRDGFRLYRLKECGEPSRTAPEGSYWFPPNNETGGFEVQMISDEKGRVWQVQLKSPDEIPQN
ncbi:MAG: hypothetical protein ACRYFS_06255 [Janthinobacterium lividum]